MEEITVLNLRSDMKIKMDELEIALGEHRKIINEYTTWYKEVVSKLRYIYPLSVCIEHEILKIELQLTRYENGIPEEPAMNPVLTSHYKEETLIDDFYNLIKKTELLPNIKFGSMKYLETKVGLWKSKIIEEKKELRQEEHKKVCNYLIYQMDQFVERIASSEKMLQMACDYYIYLKHLKQIFIDQLEIKKKINKRHLTHGYDKTKLEESESPIESVKILKCKLKFYEIVQLLTIEDIRDPPTREEFIKNLRRIEQKVDSVLKDLVSIPVIVKEKSPTNFNRFQENFKIDNKQFKTEDSVKITTASSFEKEMKALERSLPYGEYLRERKKKRSPFEELMRNVGCLEKCHEIIEITDTIRAYETCGDITQQLLIAIETNLDYVQERLSIPAIVKENSCFFNPHQKISKIFAIPLYVKETLTATSPPEKELKEMEIPTRPVITVPIESSKLPLNKTITSSIELKTSMENFIDNYIVGTDFINGKKNQIEDESPSKKNLKEKTEQVQSKPVKTVPTKSSKIPLDETKTSSRELKPSMESSKTVVNESKEKKNQIEDESPSKKNLEEINEEAQTKLRELMKTLEFAVKNVEIAQNRMDNICQDAENTVKRFNTMVDNFSESLSDSCNVKKGSPSEFNLPQKTLENRMDNICQDAENTVKRFKTMVDNFSESLSDSCNVKKRSPSEFNSSQKTLEIDNKEINAECPAQITSSSFKKDTKEAFEKTQNDHEDAVSMEVSKSFACDVKNSEKTSMLNDEFLASADNHINDEVEDKNSSKKDDVLADSDSERCSSNEEMRDFHVVAKEVSKDQHSSDEFSVISNDSSDDDPKELEENSSEDQPSPDEDWSNISSDSTFRDDIRELGMMI